jgi:hypothetical protein
LRGEGRGLHGDHRHAQSAVFLRHNRLRPVLNAVPMLRGREISRAAFVLALAVWASPALAQSTLGASCTYGSTGATATPDKTGNNVYCNGNTSTITYPAYWFGSTSTGCSSGTAGLVQWTGTVFEGCNGTAWGSLGGGWSASTTLSSLLAATTTNKIDSGNYTQTWEWGTLTTGTALTLTTSSMTGGTLLSLQDTAAASTSTGYVLSVTDATTGTGYGVYSTLTQTSNTGYAGYFANAATSGANYGVYGSASSGSGTAVAGINTSSSGPAFGVYGTSSSGSGIAVYGSSSNIGVEGNATGNSTYGVYGTTNSVNGGYGVYGSITGATNTGYGVYALNSSTSGWGIYSAGSSPNYFAGNVGIGTTNPGAPLDIYNNSTAKDLTLGAWSESSSYNAIYLNGLTSVGGDFNIASSNFDQNLYINRPSGAVINFSENNTPEVEVLSGGNLDVIGSAATATVNTASLSLLTRPVTPAVKYANVAEWALGSYSTNINANSRLDLLLTNGATSTPDATVMTWLGNGSVGIGTTNPSDLLDVNGNTSSSNGKAIAVTLTGNGSNYLTGVASNVYQGTGSGYAQIIGGGFQAFQEASGSGALIEGVSGYAQDDHGTGSVYTDGGFFQAWGESTSASGGSLSGITAEAENDNETVSSIYGAEITSTSWNTATNQYGLYVSTGGCCGITNNYGVYIAGGGGIATNNWGLYENASDPNYFKGSVGIGTTSPGYTLDVAGEININAGTGNPYIQLYSPSAQWVIGQGSEAVPNIYVGGTPMTSNYFWRANWNTSNVAANTFQAPNSSTNSLTVVELLQHLAGNTGDYLHITSNGGTSGNILTVANSGSVGIGTTSPQAALDVNGAARVGSTAASCSSTNAGAVQYTSGTLEACNGTSWIPIDSGMHFISTQTASSSASLQFTNLPTTYNTLFLNCAGLQPSINPATILFQVGEGSGPTWETSPSYTSLAYVTNSGGGGGVVATTTAPDLTNSTGGVFAAPYSTSSMLYLYNVGSSTLYKTSIWQLSRATDNFGAVVDFFELGKGYWNNDTNPITGIEVIPNVGNIASGTCSLYGMN